MDFLWLNIGLFAYLICLVLAEKRQVHMLQLSSYRTDRYLSWVKENYEKETSRLEWFLPIVTASLMKGAGVLFAIGLAACSVLMLFLLPQKKEKKPLVFTARVKRLYVGFILMCLVLAALVNLVFLFTRTVALWPTFLLVFALTALYTKRYYYLIAAKAFCQPVENMVANHYVKDAKRILAQRNDLQIIGITGSFGKTSTKYILQAILAQKYNTLMTPESFNTPMGVVRTVREKLQNTDSHFICEMGAKQKGDIREICDIVHPEHCIITSVGNCHLESFKTLQTVCDTKFELFDACRGIRVLNYDSLPVRERKITLPFLTYGTTEDCDYYVKDIVGNRFTLRTPRGEIALTTPLLGRHNLLNIAGASAMAMELGVSEKQIVFAVSHLKPVAHRLELKGSGDQLVIDDAYNANLLGAQEAVNVLSRFDGYLKVLVTPGIVELGSESEETNKEFGKAAVGKADVVIGVSHLAPFIEEGLREGGFDMKNYHYAENLEEAFAIMKPLEHTKKAVLFENDLPDNMENTKGRKQ